MAGARALPAASEPSADAAVQDAGSVGDAAKVSHIFSIVPIEACADQRLTGNELRVLIALLSFRNKNTNLCCPKREAVAERTRLTENQVSKATTGLVNHGWLKKYGRGGAGVACQYVITVPDMIDSTTMEGENGSNTGTVLRENGAIQGPETVPFQERFQNRNGSISGTKTVPEMAPTIEQTIEQTKKRIIPPYPPEVSNQNNTPNGFDEFWDVYPKKRSKMAAERAFAKIKPDEQLLAEIILGVERAKTLDHRFQDVNYTPFPASWLNAKGWMDEFDHDPAKPATSSAYAGNPKPATSSAYGQRGRNRAEREQATNITILQEWLDDERRQSGGLQPALVGVG